MRILALDVGTKTIGVAISDELGITANGVTTVMRKNTEYDIAEIKRLSGELNPEEVVVGVPYGLEGEVTKRGSHIIGFAEQLEDALKIPVTYWDESFSTVNAENILIDANVGRKKRKSVIDKIAAVFILEEYLQSKHSGSQNTT